MITSFVKIYCTKQEKYMIIIIVQILLIDFLYCKKLILCKMIFDGRTYLPFHITIPKRYDICILK